MSGRVTVEGARDTAQAVVTALLADDKELAYTIASDFPSAELLTLVMGDLCAYVHHRWARVFGLDRGETWRELMLDIAEWVEGIE